MGITYRILKIIGPNEVRIGRIYYGVVRNIIRGIVIVYHYCSPAGLGHGQFTISWDSAVIIQNVDIHRGILGRGDIVIDDIHNRTCSHSNRNGSGTGVSIGIANRIFE